MIYNVEKGKGKLQQGNGEKNLKQPALPSTFTDRMRTILKEDFDKFISELENGESSKALFFNKGAKLSDNTKKELCLSPVPFSDYGFYFDCDGIGNSPLHHSGAFYIQDPSAMATLSAVSHIEFKNVLDCCASPGGKSLFSFLIASEGGVLVSNEFNVTRCKTLVGNIERFGIKNAIVTNFDMTQINGLCDIYDSFFDLIICDAPCSGEGMFRKYPDEAIGDWSVQNVLLCADRQKKILDVASALVKSGGYLLYSTCTFSLDENELQIDDFLKSHPDFSLIPVSDEVQKVTSDGVICDGCNESIRLCRRFYPHVSKGEGQFIALMQKNGCDSPKKSKYTSPLSKPTDADIKALKEFTSKALSEFDFSKVFKYNENLIYIDFDAKIPQKKVFSCGVKLGSIEKNRFIPHHQLFKCFGCDFKNRLDLTDDPDTCAKYLHGEVIGSDIPNGWCAVTYGGFVIGGGKAVDGVVKNHYPKGLRTV